MAACISPKKAPRPGGSSISCNTKIRGAGVSRMLFQKSARSRNLPPPIGGSPLRRRAVAAYPTIGGMSSNMHRTRASANPVFRSLTLNDSMAFATRQVSICRRDSSPLSVNEGTATMPFLSGTETHQLEDHEPSPNKYRNKYTGCQTTGQRYNNLPALNF